MTLTFAIVVSLVVSLTVTPMICGHFVQRLPSQRRDLAGSASSSRSRLVVAGLCASRCDRAAAIAVADADHRGGHGGADGAAITSELPKGYFPRDDTGLIFGSTRASTDISFDAMVKLQQQALDIVLADPAVVNVGSSVGGSAASRGRQSRAHVHHPEAARRARRPTHAPRHRSAAPRARPRERHQRVPERRPGHPGRRAAERFQLPVHAVEPGPGRSDAWVPRWWTR